MSRTDHPLTDKIYPQTAPQRRDPDRLYKIGIGASLIRPRDTAARKPRETRGSSGPARLSDPTLRAVFGPTEWEAGSRPKGSLKGFGRREAPREPDRDRWTARSLG